MTCAETRELMHAYADGELDLVRSLEIEHHLAQCPDCPRAHESLRALRTALRDGAVYYASPAALRTRVEALRQENERAPWWRRWRVSRSEWPWLITAVAVLAALIVIVRGREPGVPPAQMLAREAVASHVRSLMANHLADVVSSNQHTVKPWFDGKLDFAPAVEDLAANGFPLAGGRLDYFDGRPVAALVYRRRKHFINLFTWPVHSADTAPRAESIRGYNVIHWTEAGMNYWAVSDLDSAELRQFAGLYARAAARPAAPPN